jgi:hypothetical protein
MPFKDFLTAALSTLLLASAFGQTEHRLSGYLMLQYNKTIYDRTLWNNPWAMGLGFQAFLNTKSKFKPTIECTADAYLEHVDILYLSPEGKPIDGIDGMVNLFAGVSYHPVKIVYLSFVAGPSFINGRTLLGIKPSLGFYFSKNQRVTGKLSFINIFHREETSNQDFGSISVALGIKLF